MPDKCRIVVCGATGNQGGAVVRHLLKDQRWQVVALTRNPASVKAQVLVKLGAEVLKADPADQESMLAAVTGAYGVFAVTQPWSYEEGKYLFGKEMIQGKNMIWACRTTGVKHVVFSSFLNLGKETGVMMIDNKLKMEHLFHQQQVPCTVLRPAVYMDHIDLIPGKYMIKGNFSAYASVPYVALDDIGKCAALIFSRPDTYLKRSVNVIGDFQSGGNIAGMLSGMTGHPYRYLSASKFMMRIFRPEVFRVCKYLEQHSSSFLSEALELSLSGASGSFPGNINVRDFLLKEVSGSTISP